MAKPLDLPDLERQLGQLVIDALVDASLVIEATSRLYTGPPVSDCCPEAGGPARLYVWFETIGANDACGGPIPVSIYLRQLSCWPVPANPVHANPGPFDERSTYLARCAWVGTAALDALVCSGPAARAMGLSRIKMLPTKPLRPRGACVGIDWWLQVWPQATGWLTGGGS